VPPLKTPPLVVSYFGPENTNTHMAARLIYGPSVTYIAELTKTGVFEAVENARCDVGVVPIENSTEGVVRETIDCLINRSPMIEREFDMELCHSLMMHPDGQTNHIRRIISHPQPLAQCRKWLDKNYPQVPRESCISTASAAIIASKDKEVLAIGTHLAGDALGLNILQENISDEKSNTTRFFCISKHDHAPTGRDKTSLVFTAPHERGALLKVLSILNQTGVNMTRIESRPLPGQRWEYAFVVDLEGHRLESPLKEALDKMKEIDCLAKIIGSYRRTEKAQPASKPSHSRP